MTCNIGTRVKDLYKCGTALTIGIAPAAQTAYLVYFKNWTTGKVFFIPVTSGAGVATLIPHLATTMIDANHDYQVWVTLATATNMDAKENITINSVVYTSFSVHFRTVYDATQSTVEDLASQSFTVA